jgi:hypothetical protein
MVFRFKPLWQLAAFRLFVPNDYVAVDDLSIAHQAFDRRGYDWVRLMAQTLRQMFDRRQQQECIVTAHEETWPIVSKLDRAGFDPSEIRSLW